ncbi:hypothetical protein IGI37_003146 [Enterococcus sp. AZ194]|uniref:FRG domain-containing protein n=1 Tax=Enterococcus sp. AZ194 TaxID=2774629 RepID=UPI003F1EF2EB
MNYSNLKSACLPESIFETVTIQITIAPSKPEAATDIEYHIQSFKIDEAKSSSVESNLYKRLEKHCAIVNEKIVKHRPMKWKVFYLYKELFQKIASDKELGNFNYFRGQAKNWVTIPGIFRSNTSSEFLEKFEKIYKGISVEFPQEVEYVEFSESMDEQRKRAKQLALLQHYGLRTSLLDLTRNPYIALLFMVSDSSKHDFSSGVIEAYAIDEELHEKNNIFTLVEKEEHNRRLKAQDGAFLYYDKLDGMDTDKLEKIPRVVVELCYDAEELKKDISRKINELEEVLRSLGGDISETIESAFRGELINLRNEHQELENNIDKTGIFSMIHDEIKGKLNEYFYFEKSLFPDLYKYIEYLQPRYVTDSKVTVDTHKKVR